MNKKELIQAIGEKSSLTQKDVTNIVECFMETVVEQLAKHENVKLTGFGSFEVATRAARMGRNPKTGEIIEIPASIAPKFKPGKVLKDAVLVKK
ncbi:MAG: HU family DNA-binding protein [Neisseriaceae bacterium]|nr:MAG: HU family DNA-binding protein [Neisseriaceae bacterium]